ncbi:MAG TPA: BTAD domain-containing putative transcriptional regulator [Kineosporiaceae bacterium]|nr:BTAD domain-containing putative transcriptional regulator [Kineosporiaceae bacterium]
MRVTLLGPVAVVADGPGVPVAGARLAALLARLALDAGRWVSVSALVEDLWAEAPGDPANALQSLVSRLRAVLGASAAVEHGPAGYRLALSPDDVDALRFERLARAGRRQLAERDPAAAADLLAEALGLWGGDALGGIGDPPFAAPSRRRLERLRLDATEDRFEARLRAGDTATLVPQLEDAAAAHPLRERIHAQLLRVLAAEGRTAEALEVYERLRRRLADELGADPSPQLAALHADLLAGRPGGPATTRVTGPEPPARTVRSNLPASLTSFVGREDDVASVRTLLGAHRLVTLLGPGGAGKTRLALETAHRQAASGPPPDGVWLAQLAPLSPGAPLARPVLESLGLRETRVVATVSAGPAPAGAVDPFDRLLEALAGDAVLVLDNCEHLLDEAARLVDDLLTRQPSLRILATSREPLRLPGEAVHGVDPLPAPEQGAGTELVATSPAVRLFLDRAAAARPGFVLDTTTAEPVAEICRRLDGLPLAIELAAARLRVMPVATLAARLDDRFALLTGGSRAALPRHRTLRAVVDWSWDLLDEAERSLAERVAVLPGGVTEASAAALAGRDDVLEVLLALVDKSLLQPVEDVAGQPRWRMLETIREYGIERLAERGELDAVRAVYAAYLADSFEAAEPLLLTRDQLAWLDVLTAERDNAEAALRWTVESGDAATAVRLSAATAWSWTLRGAHRDTLLWTGRALQLPGEAPRTARAVAGVAYALNAAMTDEEPRAISEAQVREWLEGMDVVHDHPLLALVEPALAIGRGDMPAAVAALHAAADHPHPWTRSTLRVMSALFAENEGNLELARKELPPALEGFRELGERWGLATALRLQSTLLLLDGDLEGAVAAVREAVEAVRELGSFDEAAQMEFHLATLLGRLGDQDGARAALDRARSAGRQGRSPAAVAFADICEAVLERHAGNLERAYRLVRAAVDDVRKVPGPPQILCASLATLAQAELDTGRPADALTHLRECVDMEVLRWDMPIAAQVCLVAAAASARCGDPATGARLLGAGTSLRGQTDAGDPEFAALDAALRDALGEAVAATAFADGAALSRAEALELLERTVEQLSDRRPDQLRSR